MAAKLPLPVDQFSSWSTPWLGAVDRRWLVGEGGGDHHVLEALDSMHRSSPLAVQVLISIHHLIFLRLLVSQRLPQGTTLFCKATDAEQAHFTLVVHVWFVTRYACRQARDSPSRAVAHLRIASSADTASAVTSSVVAFSFPVTRSRRTLNPKS